MEEIRNALAHVGLKHVSDDVLSKCAALASTLQLSPQQMAECWEALCLNRHSSSSSSLDLSTESTFQAYRNALVQESNADLTNHDMMMTDNWSRRVTTPTTSSSSNSTQTNPHGAIMTRSGVKRQVTTTTTPQNNHLPMVTPPPSKKPHHHHHNNPPQDTNSSVIMNDDDDDDDNHATTATTTSPPPTFENNKQETILLETNNVPRYNTRTNAGQVLVKYSPPSASKQQTTTMTTTRETGPPLIQYHGMEHNVNALEPYRFMFTPLVDRAKALDDQLVQVGQVLEEHYDYFESTTGGVTPVGVPRQDTITCIGRICNEAHEGRINATSVVLEGSRLASGGCRINVDLQQLVQQPSSSSSLGSEQHSKKMPFSLFPGQIVAMEGVNSTGRKLVAKRIVSQGVPPPPVTTPASKLLDMYYPQQHVDATNIHSDNSKEAIASPPTPPLKIITACGPYTTNDNLDFEPLGDLLQVIQSEKPHVVILMGPFVDCNHPDVQSGMTKVVYDKDDGSGTGEAYVPFDVLFAIKISEALELLYDEEEEEEEDNDGDKHVSTSVVIPQIVLVPSLDDATADCVYPQPPFHDRTATSNNNNRTTTGAEGGRKAHQQPQQPYVITLPGVQGAEYPTGSLGLQHVEAAATRRRRRQQTRRSTTTTSPWFSRESSHPSFHKHIHLVSNPCTFSINEIVFGVTSTDVLFHLSADEINGNLPPFSRLDHLAQHLLRQRSYYPLFPPHDSVPLDLQHMHQWSMPCRPDVLLIPSKLQCFCKSMIVADDSSSTTSDMTNNSNGSNQSSGTMVINPGRLTRGTTGGTFAVMEIDAMAQDQLLFLLTKQKQQQPQPPPPLEHSMEIDDDVDDPHRNNPQMMKRHPFGMVLHNVPSRMRVEIRNI